MNSNFTLKTCTALFTGMLAIASYGQTKPVKKFGPETPQYLKCASTEYEAYLKNKFPDRKSTAEFEQWLAPKVTSVKNQNFTKSTNSTNAIVTIPVVVHVIHNGDPLGVNENISEEQILSQIEVLNQDFRRMAGTPGFNTNPVGADMEIQFCLAQQDPDGLASSGIIRYNLGDANGWEMNEAETNLKPQTQWDPTKYLNIWVVDYAYIDFFGFEIPLAGYAQFPTGSGLDGLEDPSMPTTAETDGVLIGHLHFGSRDIYPEGTYDDETGKDRGRTTTHEVGHYFGLRHIWGDGDQGECNGNDFCDDTPAADAANQGCPTGMDSCTDDSNDDMIENYMDYTTDLCQNIFTQDQKDRMVAVLANSPRRVSLITSLGCTPGLIYDNDGSLEINGLNLQDCANSFTPSLTLRNAGNNTLTTAVINYDIDGENAGTITWNGNLELNETAIVTLPLLTAIGGEHTLNVSIATANGVDDETELNDLKSITFVIREYITQQVKIEILTDDWGDETSWTLKNSNNNTIAQGGNYDDNQTYSQTINVELGECYTFEIEDTEGDGICCMFGEGYYQLRTANNTLIAEGGSFADSDIVTFKITDEMGINETGRSLNNITLFPNPTNGVLNIAIPNNELPEGYTIYNSLGQVMAATKVTTAANLSINTSAYSNGIYFIKIEKGGQAQTLKFVKQ